MRTIPATPGTMEDKFRSFGQRIDRAIETIRTVPVEEIEDVVSSELDVWKGLLDDIQVQMKLGRMELRDQVEPLAERVVEAADEARHRLGGILEVVDDDQLEASVAQCLSELRAEIARAEELQ